MMGLCWNETKNLDGETNLKMKYTPRDVHSKFENLRGNLGEFEAISNFELKAKIDFPNPQIYKVSGTT